MTEEVEEKRIPPCCYHENKIAVHVLEIQGQGRIGVCSPCRELLMSKNKKFRCVHCGVPMKGDWRFSALPGLHHSDNCPRAGDG